MQCTLSLAYSSFLTHPKCPFFRKISSDITNDISLTGHPASNPPGFLLWLYFPLGACVVCVITTLTLLLRTLQLPLTLSTAKKEQIQPVLGILGLTDLSWVPLHSVLPSMLATCLPLQTCRCQNIGCHWDGLEHARVGMVRVRRPPGPPLTKRRWDCMINSSLFLALVRSLWNKVHVAPSAVSSLHSATADWTELSHTSSRMCFLGRP